MMFIGNGAALIKLTAGPLTENGAPLRKNLQYVPLMVKSSPTMPSALLTPCILNT